ncbi:MAG: VanZ family protein [Nitrospira sp.]|nr:VanZ family protein [Nitrospira sp.]
MLFVGVLVLSYMVVLVGLAVATPGAGLAGTLIDFVPGNWRDEAHIPAYGLLAWLSMWGLHRRGWPQRYAIPVGVFLAVVFGLWTEVAQGSTPSREASVLDLVNDLLGGLMAATLMVSQPPVRHLVSRYLRAERPGTYTWTKGTTSQ